MIPVACHLIFVVYFVDQDFVEMMNPMDACVDLYLHWTVTKMSYCGSDFVEMTMMMLVRYPLAHEMMM